MTVLHESPAVPAQVTPSRQVAVTVGGATVVVPCPLWCTDPHAEAYRSLPDVSHHGAEITLAVPVHGGAIDEALTARIESWPFTGDHRTMNPFVAYNPAGDEFAQLAPEAMAAAADQVIAHGYALRTMAASISG